MQALHIRQFETRYRLPRSAVSERSRLDRVLTVVLEEAAEQALEEVDLPPGAEVCIQTLYVPVHLRLAGTDLSLARVWSQALAEAIRRAVAGRQVSGVVYYPSRVHALIDFAAGAARGDLDRAWAWGLLGLCRTGGRISDREAVAELVRALVEESSAIVPVLSALADAEMLERLGRQLAVEQWLTLAGAALGARGAPGLTGGPIEPVPPARSGHLRRVVARSRLAASLIRLTGGAAALDHALAALVVIETDPAALSAPTETVRSLIATIAGHMRSVALDQNEPEQGASRSSTILPPLDHPDLDRQSEPDGVISEQERAPVDARRRGRTRFGGLLFLCGVVEDLNLPEEAARFAAGAGRSVRWALHRLALKLVPADVHDPAVLAFAGLLPGAEPPSAGAEPVSDAEAVVLEEFAGRIVVRLRNLLGRSDQPAGELLRLVCERRAEVIADPGWIEVHFALEEVSTELRRAGLDLDPGYLPWLGVVLKFTYG
jgi:hypothetical protein